MSKYNEACSEVSVILNHLDEEEYSKIPSEVIEAIEKNKNKDHVFEFDEQVELRKQKLLKETRAILFNLFRDYLCTPKQKEKIIQMQKEERYKIEENKKIKCNVENIFKNQKQEFAEYLNKVKVSNENYKVKIENVELKNSVEFLEKENSKISKAKDLLEDYKNLIAQKDIEIERLKKTNFELHQKILRIPRIIRKVFIKDTDIKQLT